MRVINITSFGTKVRSGLGSLDLALRNMRVYFFVYIVDDYFVIVQFITLLPS